MVIKMKQRKRFALAALLGAFAASVFTGCAPLPDGATAFDPDATPKQETTMAYVPDAIPVPEGLARISSLCADGDKVLFLA
jgi:hypothetical protein